MKEILRGAVLLIIIASLSSCGKVDEITIGDISEFKVKGFENNAVLVDVAMQVKNPSAYKIRLTDLDVNTFIEGKYIGKLLVEENVIISARKTETVQVPVKIKISNILNVAFVMMSLKSGEQVNIRFEGSLTAKSFLFKKEIQIDEKRKVKI